MKKAFSTLLAVALTLSLAACGSQTTGTSNQNAAQTTPAAATATAATDGTAAATPKGSGEAVSEETVYLDTLAERVNAASEEYLVANQEFIVNPDEDTETKLERVRDSKEGFYGLADIAAPPEAYVEGHNKLVATGKEVGDLIESSVSLMERYLSGELEGDYDQQSEELADQLEEAFTKLAEEYLDLVAIYQNR
jgi:hypothetical protein